VLPDGLWANVLALAAQAPQPVNVIVVARLVDTRLYVEAIEAGAFDFLAPPFVAADLAYVVRCAAENVLGRREAQGRVDSSPVGKLFPVLSEPDNMRGRGRCSATQAAAPQPTAKLV
jgi:FixJ family two-component response regulator